MITLFGLVQAAGLLASLQGNHRVEIDGQAYRVNVKGQTVSSYKKSVVVMRTPERGEALRKAVVLATGCVMANGYWEGSSLHGTLDCSQRPTN